MKILGSTSSFSKCIIEYSPLEDKKRDDSLLVEQVELFLSTLHVLDSSLFPGLFEDLDDATPKDRLSALNIPAFVFFPLLESVKEKHPEVFVQLNQHPLISNSNKSKKKSYKVKKNRRKDKKEKEKTFELYEGKESQFDKTAKAPDLTSWEIFRQYLAIVVAKCILDGDTQSYLICIGLLCQSLRKYSTLVDTFQGTEGGKSKNIKFGEQLSIPIGNMLALLFENSNRTDRPPAILSDQIENFEITNPYRSCILTSKSLQLRSSISSRIKSTRADESLGDEGGGSQGRSEDGGSAEDACSTGFGQFSDAGSAVGSTFGEQGTDTASVDADLEEMTEDELLAQALAMSLSPTVEAAEITPSSEKLKDSAECIFVPSLPVLQGATVANVPDCGKSDDSPPIVPEKNIPSISKLSALYPFTTSEFRQDSFSPESTAGAGLFAVPIMHVIVSLLVHLAASSDNYLGLDSAPLCVDPREHPIEIFAPKTIINVEGTSSAKNKSNFVSKKGNLRNLPLAFSTTVSSHPLTFQLLETGNITELALPIF